MLREAVVRILRFVVFCCEFWVGIFAERSVSRCRQGGVFLLVRFGAAQHVAIYRFRN